MLCCGTPERSATTRCGNRLSFRSSYRVSASMPLSCSARLGGTSTPRDSRPSGMTRWPGNGRPSVRGDATGPDWAENACGSGGRKSRANCGTTAFCAEQSMSRSPQAPDCGQTRWSSRSRVNLPQLRSTLLRPPAKLAISASRKTCSTCCPRCCLRRGFWGGRSAGGASRGWGGWRGGRGPRRGGCRWWPRRWGRWGRGCRLGR
ncbi:MAG: hypothetical protein QOH50_27 [Kribbellaceae bacterium]|nr:hypothetical protein [Kribbellaceae bacterium]